ncbi:hypothetical protein Tco_0711060, partial [Tanacetum coccineum]
MSSRDYTNPNGDQPCEEELFFFDTTDDHLFNGSSIQEDTPNSEERGHDMVPTTMVPVSRIFDHFRNICLNSLGSDYMSHAVGIALGINRFEPKLLKMQVSVTSIHLQIYIQQAILLNLCATPITDEVSVPNVHKRGCLHTVSTASSLEESIRRNTIRTQDILGHKDTPISEESIERHETPFVDVQNLRIGGNVNTRLSTGGHDMVPTTTVPVSRIFDHFRNMRLNSLGSDYMSHADNRYRVRDQQIRTITLENTAPINVHKTGCLHTVSTISSLEESIQRNTISTEDTLCHTASSSRMAPVNHAYLCMDVTNCIIRPEIITFPNSSAKNVYQSHARGDYLDTTYCRSLHNEGDTMSYIDLGKIYMPPTPDPPVFIQQLLRNSHFMKHVRAYNQMLSMTSFMAKNDDLVNRGRGPYVFKDEDTLNPEIVEGLIHILDEHNGLVRFFRTACDRCSTCEIPGFKIRLYNNGGIRGYELPTSDILGGI